MSLLISGLFVTSTNMAEFSVWTEDSSGNGHDGEIVVVEPEEFEEEDYEEEDDEEEFMVDNSLSGRLKRLNLEGLQQAILFLAGDFPGEYPEADEYLARLGSLEERADQLADMIAVDEASESLESILTELEKQAQQLRRDSLISGNPLVDFDRIVFIKRFAYYSSHFYTHFIEGCDRFGGNLCILSLQDGTVTELVPSLEGGIFGRFDLSFDARRVVFDYKRSIDEGFRIYEVGIDGKGLRQLTFAPPDEEERIKKYDLSHFGGTSEIYNHHTDDMHPCYLPDGGICFTSTRCEYEILCDPGFLTTTVLYRMDGDGSNMEKLTNSPVSEFSPTVTDDGRILYSRWEYVDKGSVCVKCLWAMNPDGTGSAEIYGNNINKPPTFLHGRSIPGHRNMFVALGTPHFPQGGVGTVIRLDTTKDIRTREPMTYITPDVDIRAEGGFHHRKDGEWLRSNGGPLYGDPYPLSDRFFMVSHNPDRAWDDPVAWGLYMLDEFGNHTLVHSDPDMSCLQPVPLRPRQRPSVIRSLRNPSLASEKQALCIVTDIYQGMEGVKRGTIKYIRINEQVPRPWALNLIGYWVDRGIDFLTAKGAHLWLRVQYGIVPVEADGSAFFKVPADRNIFFQALDENFMEVQRERTYVNYRPGEIRSCVGCHERQTSAFPRRDAEIMALTRPPSKPGPQPGEESGRRVLHYPADVQPIFDKHCISCHSGRSPKANFDLSGELTEIFNRSYENIVDRRGDLVQFISEGEEDGMVNARYLPPFSVGSHASRLIALLREGHNDIKLSQEEMIRLTTWVDSNCQYYGSYYGRRLISEKGHPNFRPVHTFDQAVSVEAPLPDKDR